MITNVIYYLGSKFRRNERRLIAINCMSNFKKVYGYNSAKAAILSNTNEEVGQEGFIHINTVDCENMMLAFDNAISNKNGYLISTDENTFVAGTLIKETCLKDDCRNIEMVMLGYNKIRKIKIRRYSYDSMPCSYFGSQILSNTCEFNLKEINRNGYIIEDNKDIMYYIYDPLTICKNLNWSKRNMKINEYLNNNSNNK
jgi:hypothetical protein